MLSTLVRLYSSRKDGVFYVVVDGAAFGAYIEGIVSFIKSSECNVYIFTPESFEYLILKTRMYYSYVKDKILNTEMYCDISKYITWERYYTDLLCDISLNRYNFSYKKDRLQKMYKTDAFLNEVKKELPDLFW